MWRESEGRHVESGFEAGLALSGERNAAASRQLVTPYSSTRKGLELFALSFVALFLELTVIRWAPSVVRLVAYYANLMLISSFLGLGVGAMIGHSRKPMFSWLPALLAANVAFLMLAQHVTLPGVPTEHRFYQEAPRLISYHVLVGIFIANAMVFVPLGQRIGVLFDALPPLQAYSWDLGGSLAGTLCFGLFSLEHFSPLLGIGFVTAVILLFLPRRVWIAAVPLMAIVMAVVAHSNDPNAIWSPYYYVTVREVGRTFDLVNDSSPTLREPVPAVRTMRNPPTYSISVNHDFYQPHCTLDPARFSQAEQTRVLEGRIAYDLPYVLSPRHGRVLVLGAGGGTDSEVAVLNGAEQVDAVEIDPVLVELSRRFNPSGIYDNPRVRVHVDDARAFLQRSRDSYDMVVFGWLDSQALFSSMSNVRLDGYIYTLESMRAAYRLLNEDGTLALSFAAPPGWLSKKLIRMVAEATGTVPTVYEGEGQVIICAFRGRHPDPPPQYGHFTRLDLRADDRSSESSPPTDDWPFLYLSGRHIPRDYLSRSRTSCTRISVRTSCTAIFA